LSEMWEAKFEACIIREDIKLFETTAAQYRISVGRRYTFSEDWISQRNRRAFLISILKLNLVLVTDNLCWATLLDEQGTKENESDCWALLDAMKETCVMIDGRIPDCWQDIECMRNLDYTQMRQQNSDSLLSSEEPDF